jgi:enamine deaminase RidA (YjgF/YER057c/UK114 family)
MERKQISSNTVWEDSYGYSRAVRIGNMVFVSGTTSTDENGIVTGAKNPYAQTVQALKNIERALNQAGATLENVVRTRIFITNMAFADTIGKAHKEVFGNIRPATTMVQVQRLISPDMLVEIEADAVIP